MELTILMPCLNEEQTIASCIEQAAAFLRTYGIAGEILVADNGSVDASIRLAKNGQWLEQTPVKLYKDERGRKSHLRSVRDGLRHLHIMGETE